MNLDFFETSYDFSIPYNFNKAFKQFCKEGVIKLPLNKPDIKRILTIVTDISIVDKIMIDTMIGVSREGQILLGKKVIVSGIINYTVEYETDKGTESICIAKLNEKFSNYIIIKNNQYNIEHVKVTPYLQHVIINKFSERKIFYGVLIILSIFDEGDNFNTNYKLGDREEVINYLYEENNKMEPREFFSSFNFFEKFKIDNKKVKINNIVSIINQAEIVYSKVIDTPKGISYEGQFLSGKAIIFLIRIKQKMLYEANNNNKSVCVIKNELYKYAYTVIPELVEGTDPRRLLKKKLLQYDVKIEESWAKNLSYYSVFNNLNIKLEVRFIPTYELACCQKDEDGNRELYIMYKDGSRKTPIITKQDLIIRRPLWCPTGESVAVLIGENNKIHIINFRDLSIKKIPIPIKLDYITNYSWTQDGKKIFITGVLKENKDIYILDLYTLKYKQLTLGEGLTINFSPKELSKNKTIAFLKSTSNIIDIWIKDINGYNTRQITKCGYIKEFNCSKDGKNIIYVFNKNNKADVIYNINIYDNKSSLIVEYSDIIIKKKIKFSSNGRFISFIGKRNAVYNIYLYDTYNKKLYNLTNYYLSSINIKSYDWEINSRKIYYTANDLGYYNIYSIDLYTLRKEQLSNSTSSDMDIYYRPRV
ncbi:hypothetical protein NRP93_003698 [Clostridium botulinum]|nr:hypothetical protein [Clostridium botulinum]